MAMNTGWEWFDNLFKNYDGNAINKALSSPVDPNDKWLRSIPIAGTYLSAANRKLGAGEAKKSTLKPVEYSPRKDNWQLKSEIFGANNLSNTAPKDLPGNAGDVPNSNATDQSAVLEGYLREIQDRLASNKAVAPTITLNTRPINTAKDASLKALTDALNSVVGGIEVARNNTKQAYGQAKTETQGAYDHIVDNSRKEGKKSAEDSGRYTQDALSKAASVAMAGVNQDLTDSDKMLQQASKSLGGSNAALREIDKKVDPNDTSATIRNNISQDYQDQAGNAARQTSRDINASSRYADTIASDGASAISNLIAELASRNNQYDRDISGAKSSNASNVASIQSTYADKLMQAQLAQQQEQNAVDRTAWQTNVNNDSSALQGMIDLIGSDNKSRLEQELLAQEVAAKNSSNQSRNSSKIEEIILEAMAKHDGKKSVPVEEWQEMLRQLKSQG